MTTVVSLSSPPILYFSDNNGLSLVGGQLSTYVGGVPYATWSEPTGTFQLPNPIILNNRGEVATAAGTSSPLFLQSGVVYTFILQDAAGNTIWTDPNVTGTATVNSMLALLTQAQLGAILYPLTTAEGAANIVPSNFGYPAGNPRRYGAAGDGISDDTGAVQTAINGNDTYTGNQGDIYGVQSVTFPLNGPHHIDFNGSVIRGIATTAQTAVVVLAMQNTVIYDYRVDSALGSLLPNPNYTCGTWWYNNSANSQFNSIFGCQHAYLVRGMIFGALPGTSNAGALQSENKIFGWQTVGVQNPFYGNVEQGFVHFSEPIFYSGADAWNGGAIFNWLNARAFENYGGTYYAQGGELQHTAPDGVGNYAADLQACHFVGMNWETATAIQVIGPSIHIIGGQMTMDKGTGNSQFYINPTATGNLQIDGTVLGRPAGSGGSSSTSMIDCSANAAFEVILQNTQSFEWRWSLINGDVRLVKGGIPRYMNHRMSITASDPNVYILRSPSDSLLDGTIVDRLGYTVSGWHLTVDFGAGSGCVVSSNAGPSGYLASQLTLTSPGNAVANIADTSSLSTIQSTAIHVAPKDLYWASCWVYLLAGSNARLTVRFFTLGGAYLVEQVIADSSSIAPATWAFVEGPVFVPASAAYMAPGVFGSTTTVQFTDLRIRRAN
jgi:hypothetical protein